MPFLALDLLNEEAFKGLVQRRYRHDAESFTWCLIYICICMIKDKNGRIGTLSPHPLSSWFTNMDACLGSKINLKLHEFPLHQNIHSIVSTLHINWKKRFNRQDELNHELSLRSAGVKISSPLDPTETGQTVGDDIPEDAPSWRINFANSKNTVQMTEPYKELSDQEWFSELFKLLFKAEELEVIPRSMKWVLSGIFNLVAATYPFVVQPQVKDQRE
jgi:hypothetical protein